MKPFRAYALELDGHPLAVGATLQVFWLLRSARAAKEASGYRDARIVPVMMTPFDGKARRDGRSGRGFSDGRGARHSRQR